MPDRDQASGSWSGSYAAYQRSDVARQFAFVPGPQVRKRRIGKVPTPMTVMAYHPSIFRGYGAFEFAIERSKLVEPKLKALASIKAATLIGCPF